MTGNVRAGSTLRSQCDRPASSESVDAHGWQDRRGYLRGGRHTCLSTVSGPEQRLPRHSGAVETNLACTGDGYPFSETHQGNKMQALHVLHTMLPQPWP